MSFSDLYIKSNVHATGLNTTQVFLGDKVAPKGGVKVLNLVTAPIQINQQSSRRIWDYLTLGIPYLIRGISFIWEGITHREKTGPELYFRFKHKYLRPECFRCMQKFYAFNQIESTPLNREENSKAWTLINIAVNAQQEARKNKQFERAEKCSQTIQKLTSLLQKNVSLNASRKNFTQSDWEALDTIDFELLKDHFVNLNHVFNSSWFASLHFQESMKEHFGVNYKKALISEALALSLAYVEGLDGKTILLPVHDKANSAYHLVEYEIRETLLGDSLPCYILESKEPCAKPWLALRGTQFYTGLNKDGKELRKGSLESILADAIDPECIAKDVINKSLVYRPLIKKEDSIEQKESLADLFNGWKQQNKRVYICGHSLGGYLSNNLSVKFFNTVAKAYSFSGTGVGEVTFRKWHKHLQEESNLTGLPISKLEEKIVNFDFEGDFVPAGGGKGIGLHLAIAPLVKSEQHGLYHNHVSSHLNQNYKIQRVDVEKENNKIARVVCERFRNLVGFFFRVFMYFCNKENIPDWWTNRKVYREQVKSRKKAGKVIV